MLQDPWNKCPAADCGELLEPEHADGLFWDGDEGRCPSCETRFVVAIGTANRKVYEDPSPEEDW